MRADAKALGEKLSADHKKFQDSVSPPEFLYHYTDAHGMHGIAFNPQCLWLTDYRSTNDPTEGRYVRSLMSQSFNKHFPRDFPWLFNGRSNANMDEASQAFGQDFSESLRPRLFTSFSERPDELSQWVHYGSNGFGYSIGMLSSKLLDKRLILETGPHKLIFKTDSLTVEPKLIRVEYDKSRQQELCDAAAQETAAFFSRHLQVLKPYAPALRRLEGAAAALLREFCDSYSFDFKDPAYSSEREWRYLVDGAGLTGLLLSPALRSRVKGTQVVWYLPIDCSVHSIRTGPKGDYEQLRVAFSHHLRRSQAYVELFKSSIPLR